MTEFAKMVAPPAGYQPGVDAEHIYFLPMAQAAQQAVAQTDPATGISQPVERAVQEAFGGGGFADTHSGASDPTQTGPSIVDTTGQFDWGGVGHAAGVALPGGSVTTGFGKIAQAVEGPYATVNRHPNARPGTPEWDANMAAQRQAHLKNQAHAARKESGGVAGVASSRDISSGPSRGRGGISDPSIGRGVADRVSGGGRSEGGGRAKSDMENERGRTGGMGGGGSDGDMRVICTELYRQGKLAREDWKRDLAFTAKHLTPQHVRGYHWWACSVVRALRRGRWVRFWSFWANHRAAEIAYLMGERPHGDWLGKAFRWTVEPACWVIGAFVGESNWRALYRGEEA